jgi:hypothetical protein
LIFTKGWTMQGIVSVLYFIILNSAFGVGIYYFSRSIRRKFTRKDIKF